MDKVGRVGRIGRIRKGEREGRAALPLPPTEPDVATVVFHQFTADIKAQPCASDVMVVDVARPCKALEELRLLIGGDANALITDAHLH